MDYQQAALDAVYLAACAVNGRRPDRAKIEGMDLDLVYNFASAHTITAIVAYALESAGFIDNRSSNALAETIRKTVLYEAAWSKIRSGLEDSGISFMPLKGAVLKDLYPKYGMREFCDYDIWFDASRAEDVKALMEKAGFVTARFGESNNDRYLIGHLVKFEMHRTLFRPIQHEKIYEYYRNLLPRLQGDGAEKHFSPEDSYIYMIAHEFKHYSGSGTGLRSLLDTYLFLSKNHLDMKYVEEEVKELGIEDFEVSNRGLALHLFGGEPMMVRNRKMLDYILSSGTYGTRTHHIQNSINRENTSKAKYALRRFLVPMRKKNKDYRSYAAGYPFFYRYKIFLPLLPFVRFFSALRNGRLQNEVKAIKSAEINKGEADQA